ncbi:MAG: Coenzyme F420 hydrogenase/dehydrogenase, beta subunit C-terminal domain, partial [Halobacteriota archaeon]|nr:Coenzyme F420 hydrogenase/dehydrogenase, beta subunit C-terminal domain [Halobacteriota archaeon]
DDLTKSSGSKYTACPSILGVWEAIEKGYEKIALVGTPCNIEAMRKIQSLHDRSLESDKVKILIGLFCTETFWYKDLVKYLSKMGVDINKVSKFDISKGKFEIYTDGDVKEVPIKELEGIARSACNICNDFASEFADISAGSVGSEEGWTTLAIRSQVGQDLVDMAIRKGVIETKELTEDEILKINKISSNKKLKNWGNMMQQIESCAACSSTPIPSVFITQ